MPRDATATRRRILDAAIREFADHGLAGARVDRIADASAANKAMIYRYFGNKEELFDAVFDEIVVQTMNDVPVDGDDLPEYAARLFDRHRERIEPLRVGQWDWLERAASGMQSDTVTKAMADKVRVVADAQKRNVVSDALPAATLLAFVLALSRSNTDRPMTTAAARRHRQQIKTAVAALTQRTMNPQPRRAPPHGDR